MPRAVPATRVGRDPGRLASENTDVAASPELDAVQPFPAASARRIPLAPPAAQPSEPIGASASTGPTRASFQEAPSSMDEKMPSGEEARMGPRAPAPAATSVR